MRAAFTTFLLLSILLLPPSHGAVPSVDASAVGTASFTGYSGWSGDVACQTGAAFAFETMGGYGALAWDAPECPGPWSPGAAIFALRCSDACFHDCWTSTHEARCDGYAYSLEAGSSPVSVTLARDGTFVFQWWAWDGSALAEARGTLLVVTWPEA